MLIIIASAAKAASRWPSGSATIIACMPTCDAPASKAIRCITATAASVAWVSHSVGRRCGSCTHRSTSVITQAITSSSSSG